MSAIAPVMLLILGGGIFGAGKAGMVNIPGVTPPKKAAAGSQDAEKAKEDKPKPTAPAKEKKPAAAAPAAALPKNEGPQVPEEKKVAQIWNEIPNETLAKVAGVYKDPELARVLVYMDTEKAAEVLAALEPERAAAVSRLVGRESVR
ncbi:MAG: hypothetical protein AB7T05_04190 [Fimbriimonadaceae bacterium]